MTVNLALFARHYDLSMGDQTLCITSVHLVESLDESLVERNSDPDAEKLD